MQLTEEQEEIMLKAKIAYDAYCAYTGGKSLVTGDNLPKWSDLPAEIRNAWFASTSAVLI